MYHIYNCSDPVPLVCTETQCSPKPRLAQDFSTWVILEGICFLTLWLAMEACSFSSPVQQAWQQTSWRWILSSRLLQGVLLHRDCSQRMDVGTYTCMQRHVEQPRYSQLVVEDTNTGACVVMCIRGLWGGVRRQYRG